jgi:cytochrome c oxidase cbb3-type subunit 3
MSELEKGPDAEKTVETTGHEWDGIRELDNPLPRWWLWIFFASFVVSVVYWVLMPAWPGITGHTRGTLQQSDRVAVVEALDALKVTRSAGGRLLEHASLEEIERDPDMQAYALTVGQSVFSENCATCHGVDGQGSKGYANLRDDIWLWGGSLEQIQHTIAVGIRAGADDRTSHMPAYGRDQMLKGDQISDLTQYVLKLSGRPADSAAAGRGQTTFAEQCAACHGADGKGLQEIGAPNLTDAEWLYGASPEAIREQIWNGRNGVMPAWKDRLDPTTLKAVTVYIHANAGGR